MTTFFVGQQFSSFQQLKSHLHDFEKEHLVKFSSSRSEKIMNSNPKYKINEDLIFSKIKYICRRGGPVRLKKNSIRKRSSCKINCPAHLSLRCARDGKTLVVRSFTNSHNHAVLKLPDKINTNGNSLNDAPAIQQTKTADVEPVLNTNKPETSAKNNSLKDAGDDISSASNGKKGEPVNLNLETVGQILKTMPNDFFDFWEFCVTVNKDKPEDAFLDFDFKLVGVYDLLARKFDLDQLVDISCHWRFYYDPPEFQTVLVENNDDQFHIGYFRDDPLEIPSILASNSIEEDCKIMFEGDNLFAVMSFELNDGIYTMKSKALRDKAMRILKDLNAFAVQKGYSLDLESVKTKARMRSVVAKTFHGMGIIIPVKNDVGYRELSVSNPVLKGILKKIATAKDLAGRLEFEEKLDEIVTNTHLANDECDFGMGLELGLDLFCFGDEYFNDHILAILPLAYKLLNRPQYAVIVEAHLKNRKKSGDLSRLITV